MSDPVVSEVESTLSPPETTKENTFPQTRPRIELWDITSSSREGKISYILFDNPLIMGDREEEVEKEWNTETTFRFPIMDLVQNVNMKKYNYPHYLYFMARVLKISIPFCLNLTYYVEAIITFTMPKN